MSLEAIKEFVVLTNGFNAEYGRSGGAVMNAVTKSGTNEYHGSGFWYFQDHTFVKDNAFSQPPAGRRSQFGGTFGGPIKKDKAFFFVTSDNQRRNLPINLVFNSQPVLLDAAASSDPARKAAAQAFLSEQKQIQATDNVNSLLTKVDWMIGTKNNLSLRYNRARDEVDNGTFGLVLQQARSASNIGREVDSTDATNLQLSTILSANSVNEFRFAGVREDRPRLPHDPLLKDTKNGVAGGSQVVVNGVGNLGNNPSLPIGSLEWRYQFTDNYTYNVGSHSLKMGVDFNIINFDNLYRGNAPGVYTFFSFDNCVAKKPDQYAQFFGSGQVTTHPKYIALFIQDTYKVKPGLTLNYGLRWEGQANPANDLPNQDFLKGTAKIPNDMKQWSPRFGFAWDPKNNGKNVIRGYSAYIYAPTPTLIWANVLRQNGDVTNGVNYLGTTVATLPAFNYGYSGPFATPFDTYPGTIPVTKGTVPGGQVNMAADGFHNPRIFRTNIAYERLVLRDLTMTITYDHYLTTGNQRRKDLNLPIPTPNSITGRMTYDRSLRPFPAIGQIIQRESTAKSRYDAFTFAMNKRFNRRYQLQMFYTVAKNRSDDDNENNCCSNFAYDQQNYGLDWGRSNLDIRHNLTFNAVFMAPFGFEVSPIMRFQSGRPFDATTGNDTPSAYALSPAALANFQSYIGMPGATVYGGGNGDTTTTDRPIINGKLLARNYFEQPVYFRTDLRVGRLFKFKERYQLKATVDILNLFNNSNKFTTNTAINSPSFGFLNNADDPFSIQTGLRFTF